MARRQLIAGNWKMNQTKGDAVAFAKAVAERLAGRPIAADLLVCPPAPFIDAMAEAAKGSALAVGGQDCHAAKSGAHTGDVAAPMLKDLGATYVIVGHSERRADHGESSADVRAKAAAAHAAGLIAVICIGETEAERDAGKTLEVVEGQFNGSLPDGATPANTVIAYEPVWAIGTGRTPTLPEVEEVHAAIRARAAKVLGADAASRLLILYGGSMKPSNAKELLALPDVDGGLIGGASLKVDDYWAIVTSSPAAQ
jgi:triosephosphate isomerase